MAAYLKEVERKAEQARRDRLSDILANDNLSDQEKLKVQQGVSEKLCFSQ